MCIFLHIQSLVAPAKAALTHPAARRQHAIPVPWGKRGGGDGGGKGGKGEGVWVVGVCVCVLFRKGSSLRTSLVKAASLLKWY